MKNKSCCFTGHRKVNESERHLVIENTEREIISLIKHGFEHFYTGGAIGFDTIAAEIVLKLKKTYPHIRLILTLPCKNQTKGWDFFSISRYHLIKKRADEVLVLSEKYYDGCMQNRNRYMVDNSSYCICYFRNIAGGTAYTLNYAIKNNINIIRV